MKACILIYFFFSVGAIAQLDSATADVSKRLQLALPEDCSRLQVVLPDDCALFVPNIVSISCGSVFDDYVFQIYTDCEMLSFELTVYNRWGEIMFETADINEGWYAGDHEDGVYVYQVCGCTNGGEVIEGWGYFCVLK